MDTIGNIRRFFNYDIWANREMLEGLKNTGNPPPRSLKILAHIMAAEDLWLVRLTKSPQKVVVWPELNIDQLSEQMDILTKKLLGYLSSLNANVLSESISYTNSKGEPWTSLVEDVLFHVIMHSSYHRGQIALDVRVTGLAPAYTDFIHCVRQGVIESA
jgi:uncharacterized damage-inducible protein DinB